MNKINLEIYTQKDISNPDIARKFLEILNNHKLQPDKINLHEPINREFNLEDAIVMWSFESDGCYEEGKGNVGKAGGMLGKRKEPSYIFDVMWWKRPDKKTINHISFFFSVKWFKKYQQEIMLVFKELLEITEAIYGYVCIDKTKYRQHVTGTIKTRMPGVFWCNYFGSIYIDFFTKERILGFSWYKVDQISNGGILTYLAKEPDKEIMTSEDYELRAKKHLGEESFGDTESYKLNPFEIQMCKVPALE